MNQYSFAKMHCAGTNVIVAFLVYSLNIKSKVYLIIMAREFRGFGRLYVEGFICISRSQGYIQQR